MTKTITSTNPRLRAAAYCRIAGGEEPNTVLAVSYTHLTLPTICSV